MTPQSRALEGKKAIPLFLGRLEKDAGKKSEGGSRLND